jgi:sialic acid synthase SpsE
VLATLRDKFGLPTGFSDHTQGITASLAAVALGAAAIEKHFTLDKSLPGPDHKASLDPQELKTMVKAIREAELALGQPEISVTKHEAPMRKVSRCSLVSALPIAKGSIITPAMITIKRPGTGIMPRDLNRVIGKTATVNIQADSLINWRQLK